VLHRNCSEPEQLRYNFYVYGYIAFVRPMTDAVTWTIQRRFATIPK
jgi:hypothetical protein